MALVFYSENKIHNKTKEKKKRNRVEDKRV